MRDQVSDRENPRVPARQTAGTVDAELARDRIEGVCLLHLGEFGKNPRLISVLKIHDENGRRSGIKFFIGKQRGKTRPVGRPASLILSATFGFSDIDGLDLLGALLQLDSCTLCKVFVVAT